MNAQGIISELQSGKTVAILSDDAFQFIREVERHGISCEGISMRFNGGQCVMTIENCDEPDCGAGYACDRDDIDLTMKQPLDPKW